MQFKRGLEWYGRIFQHIPTDKLAMEKSVYFDMKESPQRMMDILGKNVKLIVVVKDPVQRVIGEYSFWKSKNSTDRIETHSTFSDCVFIRENGQLSINASYEPIPKSDYGSCLQDFFDVGFDLSNFIFIDGDRLARDPAPEVLKLEKALGLRPMFTEDMFYFNATRGFPCLKSNIYFADGSKSVKRGGCMEEECGRSHPFVSDEEKELLYRFYAPKNRKFFKMIQMEFPNWFCYDKNKCIFE